jgi:hypothetical protein
MAVPFVVRHEWANNKRFGVGIVSFIAACQCVDD